MSAPAGVPRLKRDWVGRKVRTTRELRNGWGVIPAGTIATVAYNHSGLTLNVDPCDHCGAQMTMAKVPERDVELLPVGFVATPGASPGRSIAERAAYVYDACGEIVVNFSYADHWEVRNGVGGTLVATVPTAVLEFIDANFDVSVRMADGSPFHR